MDILEAAERYITALAAGDAGGHDHFHALRVRRTAEYLAAREGADARITALAALLHDADDIKLSPETHATLANAVSFAVALIRGAPLIPTLKSVLLGVIWGYCALFFMGLVTALGEWKKIKAPAYKKILAIFTFPVYIATNIPIAFVALFRKAEWKPIRHTRSVTDDQINGK